MFCVSEGTFRGIVFMMLLAVLLGITIRDGKVCTALHLSLH